MARFLHAAILLACFCYAGSAFASGGTCPAGPVHGADGNATLSSLGVTTCYYIAANGSDTNSGTTESSPWLHAPQMPNCSANCATEQNGTLQPGTGLIFRGGDTWHISNSSASPYVGGTWGFNSGGTLNNPIYIGVDQNWFSGAAWTRPILTGDNATSTSTTLSSCAYQAGSANIFLNFSGSSHFILDNFELTGLCQKSTGSPNGWDEYISYGFSSDMRFFNLYVHGWTHKQFGNPANPVDCGPGGTYVCFNTAVFRGGGGGAAPPDDVFRYVVIDGSDSDPKSAQACYCDLWDMAYSYIGNQSNIITRNQHLYHDNLYEYWYENGHGNVMESVGDAPGTNAIYNSVFRHINVPNDPGDPFFWPFPPVDTTDYFFNNLAYDVGHMEFFNVGQNPPQTQGQGPLVVFNNTWQMNSNSGNAVYGCISNYPFKLTAANNHIIDETETVINSHCLLNGGSDTTSLYMNNATAASKGYTNAQPYAFSPTSSGSPTVRTGTNKQSFCSALSAAGLSDAATACLSDTRYACTYNTANHTVSCPARTVVPRTASAALDVGAYQWTGSTSATVNAPAHLTATVQ